MPHEGERWFRYAAEDLRMSELALQDGLFNQACFHAQQSVEKILKGLIADGDRMPPRTHKLADLFGFIVGTGLDDLRDELILLDRFYIPTRYPDTLPGVLPEGLPDKNDAASALQTARTLWERVAQHGS